MENKMERQYTIVWHFDGTSLTSTYADEETRDRAFEELKENLANGVQFHAMGDTILNASMVLCITRGEEDGWKYQRAN